MLRKQLLRQSRTISETLTSSLPQTRRSPFSSVSFTSSRVVVPAYSQASSTRLGRRWNSSEAAKPGDESKPAEAQEGKPEETKEDATKAELEKKNKEVIDLKDKYLRSVADFRNLQERTKRDMESARQFAIQRFAADLLDSIDNLDRALTSVPKEAVGGTGATTSNTSSSDPNVAAASESTAGSGEPNKDLVNLYSGLRMTEEILLGTLKKHGLERFDPTADGGRKFDPNTDEATFFTKVEGKQDGDVFFVQSKGFKLNGRVIRAAKVGVVKNS